MTDSTVHEQRFAVGYCKTLPDLCSAFERHGPQTYGSKLYLGKTEDATKRPLAIFLCRDHFSALLPRNGRNISQLPKPHSTIVPPLL